ncbi:Nudix family hydrolase, partial [Pseudomonas syringae]
ARPLIKVCHDYPDKQVLLDVWEVSAFTGEPHGAEGQPLVWASPRELANYDFPAANQPIVAAARLPGEYLITPEGLDNIELLRGMQKAIAGGIKLVQLRAPGGYDPKYRDLAVDAAGLCAGKAQLMLKGPLEWLGDFPSAGWHLTAQQLRKYASNGRPFPENRWLAASCHSAEELALAEQMGVDFVTLSPVQPTLTHPDAQPLGWEQAAQLIAGFNKPVFLLGGVGPAQCQQAWESGAQGVAGIRAFWPD